MPGKNRKRQLLLAVNTLLTLALAAGCKGFFVNPTLTSVSVGPNPLNLTQGNKQQMTATGTFDDGSTKSLTSDVVWSSDKDTIASVSSSGQVTAVSPGTATITAQSGTVSGTATVNVTLGNVTNLTVDPSTRTMSQTGSATFDALATVQGQSGTTNVTTTATWTASPTSTVQINNTASPAVVTYVGPTLTSTINVTITATYNSNGTNFSDNATLTINP